uniref:UF2 component of NDC80 kinetochore complex n=1 Tax=Fundulus heteroclitus TaxID=8078 RepID=A0A3Q2UC86_FUNHE
NYENTFPLFQKSGWDRRPPPPLLAPGLSSPVLCLSCWQPEAVQTLYMRVLYLLFRFRPECHSMVSPASTTTLPSLSAFITRQFLPMCMVYDFSLNDLLAPKKLKTVFILSGIMNFLHFRKQRMEVMRDKERADKEKLQLCNKAIQEAERKIELLTTIPPEQQAEAEELAAALAEVQATTVHEYKEVNARNENIAELKTRIAEKMQKLAQVKVEVSEVKEDITRLKSQIVESPEELKSQMEKMKETVKKIKNSIKETDECVVEIQNRVQNMTHSEAALQKVYGLLQDLETSMESTKQRHKECQELVAQNEKMQKELKRLCNEEVHLKRVLGMKLDKECKQNIRRQKKREMKEQHVQEVLGQCDQIQQKREEMADKIQEITGETQQLKAKIKSLREVCSKETEKAQAVYDELSTSMDELHKRIEQHISDLKVNVTKMSADF